MIGALVDDFLISGDESNPRWVKSIRIFGDHKVVTLGSCAFHTLWCWAQSAAGLGLHA